MRLMIYDRTWAHRARVRQVGLTSSWIAGGALYRALGRLDKTFGATSWREALAFLAEQPRIDEIQFWGHGRWGRAYVGEGDVLDISAVDDAAHPLRESLERIRDRMTPDAHWWFRTCETFGTARGHAFASAWTRFFERRAAGHTYVIGPWQSGLHSLAPGATPSWDVREGLPADVEKPPCARMSGPSEPNTITCLHGEVPSGF